jgi:hypothetical protein
MAGVSGQPRRLLIDDVPNKLKDVGADPKVSAITNRMAMLINSVPSLQSFLADFGVYNDDKNKDGSVRVQMDFLKLPKEIIPELEKLLCVDQYKSYRIVKYIKNGQARTGLEIEIDPNDLPGEAYDYSF